MSLIKRIVQIDIYFLMQFISGSIQYVENTFKILLAHICEQKTKKKITKKKTGYCSNVVVVVVDTREEG
jgi:hypothetical protein